MTIAEFVGESEAYWQDHPSQRYGQAMFNYLNQVRPDLANSIRGTDTDPFYSNDIAGDLIGRFWQFIWDNWER